MDSLRTLVEKSLRTDLTSNLPDPDYRRGCLYGLPLGSLGRFDLALTLQDKPEDWLDPKVDTLAGFVASSRPKDLYRAQLWCLFEFMAAVKAREGGKPQRDRFFRLSLNHKGVPSRLFHRSCTKGAYHLADLTLTTLGLSWSALQAEDSPTAMVETDTERLPLLKLPVTDDDVQQRGWMLLRRLKAELGKRGCTDDKTGSFTIGDEADPGFHSLGPLLHSLWCIARRGVPDKDWLDRAAGKLDHATGIRVPAHLRLGDLTEHALWQPPPFICTALALATENYHHRLQQFAWSKGMSTTNPAPAWPANDDPAQMRTEIKRRVDRLAQAMRDSAEGSWRPTRFSTENSGPALRSVKFLAEEGLWSIRLDWPKSVEASFGAPPEMMPAQLFVWRQGAVAELQQVRAIALDPSKNEDGEIEYLVEAYPRDGMLLCEVLDGKLDDEDLLYSDRCNHVFNVGPHDDPALGLVLGVQLPALKPAR